MKRWGKIQKDAERYRKIGKDGKRCTVHAANPAGNI